MPYPLGPPASPHNPARNPTEIHHYSHCPKTTTSPPDGGPKGLKINPNPSKTSKIDVLSRPWEGIRSKTCTNQICSLFAISYNIQAFPKTILFENLLVSTSSWSLSAGGGFKNNLRNSITPISNKYEKGSTQIRPDPKRVPKSPPK